LVHGKNISIGIIGSLKVVIYGYSYGGDFAVELTEALAKEGIAVDLLVTVDASDGTLNNATVNDEIPDNVGVAVNFFQKSKSGLSSGSQNSGSGNKPGSSPSSSDNSSSNDRSSGGSSNLPGSHGDKKKAADSSKTLLYNHDMTGKVTHGNIDEKVREQVMDYIKHILMN
jgi:hypothetical protein